MFQPILTAMTNWETEIFNYFDHPITNAYTEALNGLIKMVNRTGRGYSFEALRAKILYTEGLKKIRRPRFERHFVADPGVAYQMAPAEAEPIFGVPLSILTELVVNGRI
jgi:transposase